MLWEVLRGDACLPHLDLVAVSPCPPHPDLADLSGSDADQWGR